MFLLFAHFFWHFCRNWTSQLNSIHYISLTAELVEMIDEYAYLGLPLEPVEVCQIAFDFANENNVIGFSHDLGTAGWCWFSYLLKRWPKLSVKGATNLLLQPAAASSKESKFTSVLGQMGINSPDQIWNVHKHGTEHAVRSKRVVGIKDVKHYQKLTH